LTELTDRIKEIAKVFNLDRFEWLDRYGNQVTDLRDVKSVRFTFSNGASFRIPYKEAEEAFKGFQFTVEKRAMQ
jgi:hypothetical protein